MTLWDAVLLGAIQGLTEFLPVSSRGHLALAQALMPGFSQPGLVVDVALHLGTVLSVLALEWRRIVEAVREDYWVRLGIQLVVAMAGTAVIALPFRKFAEGSVLHPLWIAVGFAVTAGLLLSVRNRVGHVEGRDMAHSTAGLIGLAQGAVVLLPGMSRSGTTIVAGLATRLERRWAADFSFLLSVPTILGAAFVEGWSHRHELAGARELLAPTLVGMLVAAVTGFFSLVLVRRLVLHGRLHLFAFYLLPLALLTVVLHLAGVW